jgi:uncharacterized membrane protein YedE/YeeE
MKAKLTALIIGAAAGFVVSWGRLSDPAVIRDMLLMRDPHVFLVMGSAVAVAAVGVRMLRAVGVRAFLTGEPIGWSVERPRARHVGGAALFAVGWSVAGTCPGPVAAMVGEGRLGGLAVVAGLLAGVILQRAWAQRRTAGASAALATPAVV